MIILNKFAQICNSLVNKYSFLKWETERKLLTNQRFVHLKLYFNPTGDKSKVGFFVWFWIGRLVLSFSLCRFIF